MSERLVSERPISSAAVAAAAYLHHMELASPDPARMAAFYESAMQMTASSSGAGTYLCAGPDRRLLIKNGAAGALGFAAFACADGPALDALRAHIAGNGVPIGASPSPLFDSRAFSVRDPEGNVIVFGLANEPAGAPTRLLNGPLQHITFASTDLAAMEEFYAGKIGFSLTDRVRDDSGRVTTFFVRSTHEHHTIGCFLKEKAQLDHHSYETGAWITIRDWADHLGAQRIPIVWGPGRHGPGNNIFIFIKDPDGNMIEISAEIEYVRDRPVKEWKHEPYTLNMWGPAIMRI